MQLNTLQTKKIKNPGERISLAFCQIVKAHSQPKHLLMKEKILSPWRLI
jgi:hypothetical protein